MDLNMNLTPPQPHTHTHTHTHPANTPPTPHSTLQDDAVLVVLRKAGAGSSAAEAPAARMRGGSLKMKVGGSGLATVAERQVCRAMPSTMKEHAMHARV
jgi:hypothetical protein